MLYSGIVSDCDCFRIFSYSSLRLFGSKMCYLEKETEIKKVLRNLCLTNGWSYGVFWRFDQRNSMLLALEDVYYEEYAKSVIDDMLLQVHMLGEGIVGQAALDVNHRWVLSDSSTGKCNLASHLQIQKDNSDFSCEFSSGIKTLAVIPLESCGVLQFGSVLKILENPGFVDQTRQIFQEMSIFDGLVPSFNTTSSLMTENIDRSGQFAPMIPSYNSQTFEFGNNVSSCTDPISATNISLPSSSYLDNEGNFSGLNPLSLYGASVDNQCLEFSTPYDDDILQCLYSLPQQCATVSEPIINDDILQALIADLPMISSQCSDLPSSNSDILSNGFQTHFGNVKREQTLEDVLFAPLVDHKNTSALQHFSEVKDSLTMVPKRGLFSELGLDQLLSNSSSSCSFAKSSIEDPISVSKKRRMDYFPEIGKQASLSSFTGDVKSCVTDQTKRSEEFSKATKKRARAGESTRPRPKDRQMIQDRIKELREIIPNSEKCSIDSLLERTIKHMLFMQGVTKYVDKFKRAEEAKVKRKKSNNGVSSSAAWAIEVGSQNPIIVEDLGQSGQMLIEMVCEEQGLFLEIADVIRGFGLTILKGEIEARDGQVLAHFIVEANRQVTRVEVLMSLLQLLKDTSTAGLKSVVDRNRVVSNKESSLLNNYHHQPIISLPIGLADALR